MKWITWRGGVETHQRHLDAPSSRSNLLWCSPQDNPRPTYSTTSQRKHLRSPPCHPRRCNGPRSSSARSNPKNPETERVEARDSSNGSESKQQTEVPWTGICSKPHPKPCFGENYFLFFWRDFAPTTRFRKWVLEIWNFEGDLLVETGERDRNRAGNRPVEGKRGKIEDDFRLTTSRLFFCAAW